MIESVACEVCGAHRVVRVSPPYLCHACREFATRATREDDDDYPLGQVQG